MQQGILEIPCRYFTFRWPCIVISFIKLTNLMQQYPKFSFVTKTYMFRASSVPIIRGYPLYTRQMVRFMQGMWPLPIYIYIYIYRLSQEECARLREGIPYVKVHRYNPKHLCPKLNGYGDKSARKVWSSCGSTYCTWFAWRNTHTLRIVRPCLQPARARSSLRLHM